MTQMAQRIRTSNLGKNYAIKREEGQKLIKLGVGSSKNLELVTECEKQMSGDK
ncbi:hypothetical protein VHP8226_01014 [Vibrio hippocampi]|uniref:Uncharacterized protein n=1 Tax=Vibrio hippocampi TaxID=654686 RepID=A0ABN8DEF4_9VIBR|nr:hypothetical protein VHP8226_01014 [Vibrio hippocampi]